MSVEFGNDGTLYCNTVKYNWKQARNMVADGCYGNLSGTNVWTMTNAKATTTPAGYKSYRCFNLLIAEKSASIVQSAPTPIAGHKYYGALMLMTPYANASGKFNFQWYCNASSIGNARQDFISITNFVTSNNWIKLSGIVTFPKVTSGDWVFRAIAENYPRTDVYITRLMVVDLTDTFGADNEPTIEWCDNNIREWNTLVNFGCVSSNITTSNPLATWTVGDVSNPCGIIDFPYLSLESNSEPREYMYMWVLNSNATNGNSIISVPKFGFDPSSRYYFYYEGQYNDSETPISGKKTTFSYPKDTNFSFGSNEQTFVYGKNYSGGGGMSEWKRISCFGTTESGTAGEQKAKIHFNTTKTAGTVCATGINIISLVSGTLLGAYNNYNATNITVGDINKEWCDRWIDGRSSPIIHIKDPKNTAIKFNTDYDIICNDIEIRPEISKISMDSTGTIRCKKLVRVQNY